MTESQVRSDLPNVPVLLDGRLMVGRLSGRELPFARVALFHGDGRAALTVLEFSWTAVARAATTNNPLLGCC